MPVCSMPYDAFLRATPNPEASALPERSYVNQRGFEVAMLSAVADSLGFVPDFINPPDKK